MDILVKKTNTGLKPCYDSDFEKYSKIPLGEEFYIKFIKKRNLKFHKKFFALIKLCFENQERYNDMETLRRDIIIETGRYTEVVNHFTGVVTQVANSIAFASMDEFEFSELYEDCKRVICDFLHIDNETVEEEIQQYF